MPAGRPPLYETVEEMEAVIDKYFESCVPKILKDNDDHVLVNPKGYPVMELNPPTLTGLALALGYCSRQSIYDNENKNDKFSYAIKKARLKCENFLEKYTLSGDIPAAAGIFALKNHGWSDKQEIDHTTKGQAINVYFGDGK